LLSCDLKDKSNEYDVLFYGAMSTRRNNILKQLRNNNISIYPRYLLNESNRTIAWSKSKIILNLHYTKQKSFESLRVITCLANELFVISETSCENHIFKDGQHLIFSDLKNLTQTIKQFLIDDKARKTISHQGCNFVRKKTSMTNNLEKIIHKMYNKKRIFFL